MLVIVFLLLLLLLLCSPSLSFRLPSNQCRCSTDSKDRLVAALIRAGRPSWHRHQVLEYIATPTTSVVPVSTPLRQYHTATVATSITLSLFIYVCTCIYIYTKFTYTFECVWQECDGVAIVVFTNACVYNKRSTHGTRVCGGGLLRESRRYPSTTATAGGAVAPAAATGPVL